MKVLLQGIQQVQAQWTSPCIRLPITASLMQHTKAYLSADPVAFINVLIWAACCVGIFGYLHCGEFLLLEADQFNANRHLTIATMSLEQLYSSDASSYALRP